MGVALGKVGHQVLGNHLYLLAKGQAIKFPHRLATHHFMATGQQGSTQSLVQHAAVTGEVVNGTFHEGSMPKSRSEYELTLRLQA